VILILLAVIVGGWFYMQRRDFERKTSPVFLNQLKNVTITLSEAKETRSDGKTQIYVTLKNGSGRIFDGKIILYSREINGVILDRTSLTIMPVSNGGSVTLVAWLRKSSIRPDFQYELDVTFK
jgi:hypothetical protein